MTDEWEAGCCLSILIDESVRGSNLSLNGYPRPTTTFLQSLETLGLLKNLGICVAASSFSHISNASLHVLVKAFGNDSARALDRWMDDKTFKDRRIDLETTKDLGVARALTTLLNEGCGYFIVVNKKGLHFNYRDRYPDDPASSIWKPVMKASQAIDPGAAGREKLVNTYDNGIRFQVDEFFRLFVSETTNHNCIVLYTSDHGQTLSEHGQAYTHMKPDQESVDVPAFLVSGDGYGKKGC